MKKKFSMKFENKSEKFFYFKIPIFLFSLIPIFLITGPFISDLSISYISLSFLIYCLKKNNFIFFKNRYFIFFLFFWAYLVLNSLVININFDSLKISFFYFRYAIFVIAITALLSTDDKFKIYFFYTLVVCFGILIADGFFQYFNGKNILGFKSPNIYRVTSFFHDEMILGSYLSRLWPIFFGLSIVILNKKDKLFYLLIFIFIFSEILIFLSGDRTAFFYINLSAVFIILFSNNLSKLRLFTLLVSLILIFFISLFYPSAKERVIDATIESMFLEKENKIVIFTEGHTEHYIAAYKIFLDNKLFGVGVKNFRKVCKDEKYYTNKYSCSTHPHNYYMQILSEIGMFGFLFIFIVLIYIFKEIFKHISMKLKKKSYFNDFEICILSGIIIYLWPFVPTGNFFNNWLNIILILNLPFLIWNRKNYR